MVRLGASWLNGARHALHERDGPWEEINSMHCSWPIPDDHRSSHERENALPLEPGGAWYPRPQVF